MAFMNLVTVNAYLPEEDGIYTAVLSNCLPTGTYTNASMDISINLYLLKNSTQIDSFSYSLDGASNSTLSHISKDGTEASVFLLSITDFSKYIYYSIFGSLENLANGNHRLQVYAYFLNGTARTIRNQPFMVNTDYVPPQLTVISPQNQSTYNNTVPLVFYTDSKVLWSYYSLDSSSSNTDSWIPFSGNMTLNGLSEGYHKLTISVQMEVNTQSARETCTQTVDFNFGSSQNNLLLSINNQENVVVIAIAVVAIVAVALVIFYNRNKLKVSN